VSLSEDSGASGDELSRNTLALFRFIGDALQGFGLFLEEGFSSLDFFIIFRLIIVEEADRLIFTLILINSGLLKSQLSVRLEGADSLGHHK